MGFDESRELIGGEDTSPALHMESQDSHTCLFGETEGGAETTDASFPADHPAYLLWEHLLHEHSLGLTVKQVEDILHILGVGRVCDCHLDGYGLASRLKAQTATKMTLEMDMFENSLDALMADFRENMREAFSR